MNDELRNSKKIRIAMLEKGIRQMDIAEKLGITQAAVSHVVTGRKRNHRVAAALIEAGIPEEYFYPEMQAGDGED